MSQAESAWKILNELAGAYHGKGTNHEGQPFSGELALTRNVPGKVLGLEYIAEGGGKVFHEETSWIGFEPSGALMLYVVSNNHPCVTPHIFDRLEQHGGASHIVFRSGEIEDRSSFREEITFSAYADHSLGHQYAWGMPGGDFAPRSGLRLTRSGK